jgi:hypothetical protein
MLRRRISTLLAVVLTAGSLVGWHARASADVPRASIVDTSAVEGDKATLTVTLSSACASGYVDIPFDTESFSSGRPTGTAVENADYPRTKGNLVFLEGVTTRSILINTLEDSLRESTEFYGLFLGTPGGTCSSSIADGDATASIVDDDGGSQSGVSATDVEDAKVKEGNAGTATCVLPVTLDPPSGQRVTVHWSTADGSATAGSDYQAAEGTVEFASGSSAATIPVTVIGDRINERGRSEDFSVTLDAPTGGASLGRSQARCSIREGKRG